MCIRDRFKTWTSKFFPYQRKLPDKLFGHLRIWPNKTYFWLLTGHCPLTGRYLQPCLPSQRTKNGVSQQKLRDNPVQEKTNHKSREKTGAPLSLKRGNECKWKKTKKKKETFSSRQQCWQLNVKFSPCLRWRCPSSTRQKTDFRFSWKVSWVQF